MHLKLTYNGDGTIDIQLSAQSVDGVQVARLINLLKKLEVRFCIERTLPSGAPLGSVEAYEPSKD